MSGTSPCELALHGLHAQDSLADSVYHAGFAGGVPLRTETARQLPARLRRKTGHDPCIDLPTDMQTQQYVHEIMSHNVAVLREEENLESADQGMKAMRFRHVPVVDGKKLVGLVTERDLLRASVSTLDRDHRQHDSSLKKRYFIREIMITNVIAVRPETRLLEALELMCEKRLGCLPVTEADGTLVGIVTRSDFLNLAVRLLKDSDHGQFEAMRRTVASAIT